MAQDTSWMDKYRVGGPTLPEQAKAADLDNTRVDTGKKAVDTERTRQLTPAEVAKAFTDAKAADFKLSSEQEDRAKAKRTKAFNLSQDTDNVLAALSQARSLVSGWSTGWGSTLRSIPETDARSLYAIFGPNGPVAANNLLKRLGQAKEASPNGASGFGSLTQPEGEKLVNSITSLDLGRSPEEVLDSINRIELNYRRYAAAERGEDPDNPDVAVRYGIIPPEAAEESKKADAQGSPPDLGGGVTGGEDVQQVAGRKGLNVVVRKMIEGGRTASQIKEYLNNVESGLGDKIEPGALEWWEKYYKQPAKDPRAKRLTPDVNLETLRTQTSGAERLLGQAGDTPVGAYTIGAADMLTGGLLDDFTSNPAGTRAALKGIELERPDSFLTGQLSGGMMQAPAMEGLAARYGVQLAPRALDAMQGGLYGYGTSSEEGLGRWTDAATSAAMSAVLGKTFETGGRAVARGVRGIDDMAKQYLHGEGIPMTIGELIGGGVRRVEDKAADLPLVGGMIRNRLAEGTEKFNQVANTQTLSGLAEKYREPIQEVGAAGVRKARAQASKAFDDAFAGVRLIPDEAFTAEKNAALGAIGELHDVGPKVLRAVDDRLGDLLENGRPLTGKEFQEASESIARVHKQFRNNEMYSSSIAPRLDSLEDSLRGLVNRQAPDVLPAYDAAKQAWRRTSITADAAEKASKRGLGDERGVFTPSELQAAGIDNASRFTGKNSSVTKGYPLQTLAEAGQDVMTPRTTRGFALGTPLSIGATAGLMDYYTQPERINPQTGEVSRQTDPTSSMLTALGIAGAAGLPYSRVAQRGLQNMLMTPRSAEMAKLGDLGLKYLPPALRSLGATLGATAQYRGLPETPTPAVGDVSFALPEVENVPAAEAQPAPPSAAPAGEGYTVEVGGVRIPLGPGDWYDAKTGELVSANGQRVKLSALVGGPAN